MKEDTLFHRNKHVPVICVNCRLYIHLFICFWFILLSPLFEKLYSVIDVC